MATTPLAVLDLVPISFGSTAAEALRNSIDLARAAESLGYARYWFAEHHLNPGVAGTSPAVVLALTAAATSTIRIGSGAVQMGHRTALSTVVSADVVVAEDEATARALAAGYGLWVRSIRSGEGAIPFPTPEQARAHAWTAADRALVADRVDTQFAGSPGQVADKLEQLQDATGADELIITTITHDHADRVRSYQLLAEEWHRR